MLIRIVGPRNPSPVAYDHGGMMHPRNAPTVWTLSRWHVAVELPPVDPTGRAIELHVWISDGRSRGYWVTDRGLWCGTVEAGEG
jgi:hypothetical protein